MKIAEAGGYDFALLRGVIEVNEQQYERVTRKILELPKANSETLQVCILGLTFKAGTDDLRDSPALVIIQKLLDAGACIRAYDPTVRNSSATIAGVEVSDDARSAITGSDVIAVLTEWPEFVDLVPIDLIDLVRAPNVVDARNILNRESWLNAGFAYRAIGR